MKKILRKAVFLMVAICVSISIETSVSYALAAGATEIEQSQSAYFDNVNRSIEIYDDAMNQFVVGKDERSNDKVAIYNDDFAGAFIDSQGILNIGQLSQHAKWSFMGK